METITTPMDMQPEVEVAAGVLLLHSSSEAQLFLLSTSIFAGSWTTVLEY